MGATMSEQETLLTPSEVAALFRVDPKTVTRWAKAGKLTSIRTLGGHRRYKESEIDPCAAIREISMKRIIAKIAISLLTLSFVGLTPIYLAAPASALGCAVPYPDGTIPTGNPTLVTSSVTYNSMGGFHGVELNGKIYFVGYTAATGFEPAVSDGTAAGTTILKDIDPGTSSGMFTGFTVFNNHLYFSASDGVNGYELWTSDGTTLGTVLVKDINADDGVVGQELWVTNGTFVGTHLVKDLYPGSSSGVVGYLTAFNNKVVFEGNDGVDGTEPYISDGSSAGTVLLGDVATGSLSSYPSGFTVAGSKLFFEADDNLHGYELWVSDGTAGGTTLVDDIAPGLTASYPSSFAALGNKVVFAANDGVVGSELWSSDGTLAGTALVKDIYSGASSSGPGSLTAYNGKVYFNASEVTDGNELWVSDGTTSGTTLLKDINHGNQGSNSNNFKVVNGKLYFVANDCTHGNEVWSTDGTASGTALVRDINPGPVGNMVSDFGYTSNALYFYEDDGTHGTSLWALTTAPAAPVAPVAPPTLIVNRPASSHTGTGAGTGTASAEIPPVRIGSTPDSITCTADPLLLVNRDSTTDASGAIQKLSLVANGSIVATGTAKNGVVVFKRSDIAGGITPGVTYICQEDASYQGAVLSVTSHQLSVEIKSKQVNRTEKSHAWSDYLANFQKAIDAHKGALAAIKAEHDAAIVAHASLAPAQADWQAEMTKWAQVLQNLQVARQAAIDQAAKDAAKVLSDSGVGLVG
eukprot:gene1198-1213_t